MLGALKALVRRERVRRGLRAEHGRAVPARRWLHGRGSATAAGAGGGRRGLAVVSEGRPSTALCTTKSTRPSVTKFPAKCWPAAVSKMTPCNWVSSRRRARTHCRSRCWVRVMDITSFLSVPILISSTLSQHFGCPALHRWGDPGFIPGGRDRGALFFSSSCQDWLQQGTVHWVESTQGGAGAFLS